MRAGKLDRRIVIQSASLAQNSVGEAVETWATWKTVWATVQDLRGREYFQSRAENAEVTTKFTIRHLDGLKAEMRISYDGDIYDIEHISHMGRRVGIEIMTRAAID